jgi:hypothetical protein
VRLGLGATPGRRGVDVVPQCASLATPVVQGSEMARWGETFLAPGQHADRGIAPFNRHLETRAQVRAVESRGAAEKRCLSHIGALASVSRPNRPAAADYPWSTSGRRQGVS